MEKFSCPVECNLPTPRQAAACDPGYNIELATILIKDVDERFRIDWKHRQKEFEEAARAGKLNFRTYPTTEWVEVNGRSFQYNAVLECNDRLSYFFLIELKRGPTKAMAKKKLKTKK